MRSPAAKTAGMEVSVNSVPAWGSEGLTGQTDVLAAAAVAELTDGRAGERSGKLAVRG